MDFFTFLVPPPFLPFFFFANIHATRYERNSRTNGAETKRIAGSRISNFPRIIPDYRGGHGHFLRYPLIYSGTAAEED